MGLPAAVIADLQAAGETAARGFEVWSINMPVVDAFLAVATQWRTAALADGRMLHVGLDYTAVCARLGDLTNARWSRLAVMEREAARLLNGGS